VSLDKLFLLRTNAGDLPVTAEAEIRDWLQSGQCRPAGFLYDFVIQKWSRAGDHPAAAALFAQKPTGVPDRRVIYYLEPGGSAAAPLGPFSTKEIQARAQNFEICASTWVFIEGDKEWRQVRHVKILNEMLPALPLDQPALPAEEPILAPLAAPPFSFTPAPASASAPLAFETAEAISGSVSLPLPEQEASNPSIKLDFAAGMAAEVPPPAPPLAAPVPAPQSDLSDLGIEREEVTLALDIMGLNLHSDHLNVPPVAPPPKPGKPSTPPMPSAAPVAPLPLASAKDEHFDGIVAEIPMDAIWLVKQASSEAVNGPFRFLEVIKFLEEGRLNKNDKIARTGNKAFAKIGQQYEFNVKFSVENVMENGQEKQKILIRRRHPRVPYITGVQIVSRHGLLAGQCVNISAGGILMEAPKAEFNLGEIIEVKILPGLIPKAISSKSLIIGKIPKIPPGYALKFEDLKPEDKEAIEHYVQETLKREMQKKN
jgi:hypothetical protein